MRSPLLIVAIIVILSAPAFAEECPYWFEVLLRRIERTHYQSQRALRHSKARQRALEMDALPTPQDLDHDGLPDTIPFDMNGDGRVDSYQPDLDQNGIPDAVDAANAFLSSTFDASGLDASGY